MISEGSCYTEDWSNDAENSTLHHMNKPRLYLSVYAIVVENNITFEWHAIFSSLSN